ncbi:hypothetical protein [Pseudomonas paeninsulae]|nr:hypothetical protein [Pseudomonas sp. IT1137]
MHLAAEVGCQVHEMYGTSKIEGVDEVFESGASVVFTPGRKPHTPY